MLPVLNTKNGQAVERHSSGRKR